MTADHATKPLSLREFGRRIGVSHVAVVRAIQRGRLKDSVGRNQAGRSVILDAERALEEWETNGARMKAAASQAGRSETHDTPAAATPAPKVAPVETERPPRDDDAAAGDEIVVDDPSREALEATSLVQAQRLATLERARAVRLDTDVKRGLLVDRTAIVKLQFESDRIVREAMLNIAPRLSAELAAETDPARVYLRLDAALREALSSVAVQFTAMAAAADQDV